MSQNQAHKNRVKAENIAKKDNMIFSRAKKAMRMLKGEAKRMENDPKLNPAGKAKFDSSKSKYTMKMGLSPEGVQKVFTPFPDPSASARGAQSRQRRTTQSSTSRKLIK